MRIMAERSEGGTVGPSDPCMSAGCHQAAMDAAPPSRYEGRVPVLQANRELLDAFRRGERAALATVYRAYVDDVYNLVRRGFSMEKRGVTVPGVSQPERQRDLVQDVFLRAFSERARLAYDGLSPYRPYLLRIAKNLIIDEGRRLERLVLTADPIDEAEVLPGPEWSPEEEAHWSPLRAAARSFCEGLAPDLQRFVKLRFEEEASQAQVAKAMGVTRRRVRTWEETIRKELLRHLRRLGRLLE